MTRAKQEPLVIKEVSDVESLINMLQKKSNVFNNLLKKLEIDDSTRDNVIQVRRKKEFENSKNLYHFSDSEKQRIINHLIPNHNFFLSNDYDDDDDTDKYNCWKFIKEHVPDFNSKVQVILYKTRGQILDLLPETQEKPKKK